MNSDKLKMYAARTLRSEDAVLLELTTEFSVEEINDAYKKMFDFADLLPDKNVGVVARSIMAIGMSTIMRSITERRLEQEREEPRE